MATIQYLTMNSVREGVGASQVREYVRRLPDRGHAVSLLSFERPGEHELGIPGVDWTPKAFGSNAPWAPARRIGACIRAARRAGDAIVHARSDLPALATILAGSERWIWDMRAFWREQRIALGAISDRSVMAKLLERVEGRAARDSSAIICLAEAAVPILQARFGATLSDKISVIPTSVDTNRFTPGIRPLGRQLTVLLSGTYNAFYDGVTTARLLESLHIEFDARVVWIGEAADSPWHRQLAPFVDDFVTRVAFYDMPATVRDSDVGIVVCRQDAGAALGGAMPTKIAEFLACGRPVVVNRGLGDMDRLIDTYHCGVVIDGDGDLQVQAAVAHLSELLRDPGLAERCRACAADWFDLERNVDRLSALYDRLANQ